MSELTRAEIEDLRNEINPDNGWIPSEIARFHALCDAALRGLTTAEPSEPDAWLYTVGKPGLRKTWASIDPNDGTEWPIDQWTNCYEKRPLYLAAPAAQRQAVVPEFTQWFERWRRSVNMPIAECDEARTAAREAWSAARALSPAPAGMVSVRLEDVQTVLRGFEKGVFVRNVAEDANPSWAIRLVPYLTALARLERVAAQPKEET